MNITNRDYDKDRDKFVLTIRWNALEHTFLDRHGPFPATQEGTYEMGEILDVYHQWCDVLENEEYEGARNAEDMFSYVASLASEIGEHDGYDRPGRHHAIAQDKPWE